MLQWWERLSLLCFNDEKGCLSCCSSTIRMAILLSCRFRRCSWQRHPAAGWSLTTLSSTSAWRSSPSGGWGPAGWGRTTAGRASTRSPITRWPENAHAHNKSCWAAVPEMGNCSYSAFVTRKALKREAFYCHYKKFTVMFNFGLSNIALFTLIYDYST